VSNLSGAWQHDHETADVILGARDLDAATHQFDALAQRSQSQQVLMCVVVEDFVGIEPAPVVLDRCLEPFRPDVQHDIQRLGAELVARVPITS